MEQKKKAFYILLRRADPLYKIRPRGLSRGLSRAAYPEADHGVNLSLGDGPGPRDGVHRDECKTRDKIDSTASC